MGKSEMRKKGRIYIGIFENCINYENGYCKEKGIVLIRKDKVCHTCRDFKKIKK